MKKSIHILASVSLFIWILFFSLPLVGGVIHVPGDYSTIQAGIDAATAGDTVLVQPDTYAENINFNGNNIVVGSLFLTTGNTSYISQTIINSNFGIVVSFENNEDSTAVLCGFTIKGSELWGCGIRCNGSGPKLTDLIIRDIHGGYGGGISCSNNANPQLINVTVTNNHAENGGGIHCVDSNIKLNNVTITNNEGIYIEDVSGGYGGGIYAHSSNIVMKDVVFMENDGGGIFIENTAVEMEDVIFTKNNGGGIVCFNGSILDLRNVTIRYNYGSGINCNNSQLNFSSEKRCNIYLNYSIYMGRDIDISGGNTIDVVVDTFTVLNPTDFHIYPISQCTYDILHAKVIQSAADLYVSPSGDDDNSGLTPSEPLRSIRMAIEKVIADNLNPRTIFLDTGNYSGSTTNDLFPIAMKSYLTLQGDVSGATTINNDGGGHVFYLVDLNGVDLNHVTITGGSANRGGGIYCKNSSLNLNNVDIKGNQANYYRVEGPPDFYSGYGGGIYCDESQININNSTIHENSVGGYGGGIYCSYSTVYLKNVNICNNEGYGTYSISYSILSMGGGISIFSSQIYFENVIVSENTAIDGFGGGIFYDGDNLTLSNVTISKNQAYQGDGIYQSGGDLLLMNAIVWDNEEEEIRLQGEGNTIEIAYSDIQGGMASVIAGEGNTLNWLEGNIDADPLFVNPYIGDFRLQAGSPCIDTGDPDLDDDGIPWQSDPDDQDPDGTRLDMGALYYQIAVTSLEITYPAAPNITWERLTREEIQWNSFGSVGSHIKMYVYKEGIHYYTIDESTPNTGSYSWFVSRRVEPGNYQILIMSTTNTGIYDFSSTFSIVPSSTVPPQQQYIALQIEPASVPVLDGILDDVAWSGIDVDSLVYGGVIEDYMADWTQFSDNLVFWQAVWCDETNKLYVGIEIQDDIRGTYDNEPGSANYYPWHDENLEFLVDGDYSGGDYYETFNEAQYWRVTEQNSRDLSYYPDLGSYPQEYTGDAFMTAVQQGSNGNWTCEAVFEIYNNFPGSLRDLEEGDIIGWDVWYNDSDDETYNGSYYETDHQTGWNYQGPVWRRTDYSGDLILGGLSGLQYLYVTYPNDPDMVFLTEETVPIAWQSYSTVGEKVKLDLYQENQYHSNITDNTDNDGSYGWLIPANQEVGSGFKVKVASVEDTTKYDCSDHSFTIQKKPKLFITSPDTEHIVWQIGQTYDITWDWQGEVGEWVWLTLERKNVYYAYNIVDSTANDGLFSWLVPADIDTGSDYRIRVRSLFDPLVLDYSDSTFTIELAPALTITYPDTNDVIWKTGEEYTITWTSLGNVGDWVKLDLYEQEAFKQSITDSTENDGAYEWTVPTNLDSSSDYKIKITSKSDTTIYDFSDSSFTIMTETSVEGESLIPLTTTLYHNYPNPFNPETTIQYEISKTCDVKIRIYNLLGKEVRSLVHEKKQPGVYEIQWNGKNNRGIQVSSGIFILEMQAGEYVQRRKMSLLR